MALVTSSLGLSFASAQQKDAREETSGKDKFTHNFLTQHEIGRRFRIDPSELPAPKTSAIVTNRSLTVPYSGQAPQVPPGFTATAFATGLVNPRRLLVLPEDNAPTLAVKAMAVHQQAAIGDAIVTLSRERNAGLLVLPDSFTSASRATIIAAAALARLLSLRLR